MKNSYPIILTPDKVGYVVFKKNCTIPSWLNFETEKAGVNFSAILTAALKTELKIQSR